MHSFAAKKIKYGTPLLTAILFIASLAGLSAQETKWIKIGSLHSWYMASGSEPEVARRGLISDQQDGLRWPAQYRNQDTQAAKALWIGTTNYTDVRGTTYAHKVVHVGPRVWDDELEFMPVSFKLIGRYQHPAVIVDGVSASDLDFDDNLDEIDESIKPDRIIYNVVNTSIGITMTRKIMAWSQQYHDNYFIYEYVFKNTGIVDKQGTLHERTLTDVWFFFQYRYAISREVGPYGLNYLPQSTSWGHNTMLDARGEDPNSDDPFRALFAWHGRHSKAGFDNIGGPYKDGDGRLGAAQYVGVVTLHADTSPQDPSNDPYQPRTTQYQGSDEPFQSSNDQFNPAKMDVEYRDVITAGHPEIRHADAVGDGFADEFGGTPGGYSHTQGFGPYTLAPGDSIRIVLAEGVAGLSRRMAFDIGAEWLNGQAPFTLPDGSTTNDADEFKNEWVYTGQDSLFQTFERAIANYESGYNIPVPPPAPNLFKITSGGDRIILEWADNAESWPGFAGYRIFRARDIPDTTYQEIFACGKGTDNPTIVNRYEDTEASRGFDYYYYIVSFDDGSNNDGTFNPAGSLQSSRFLTQTNEPANLKRPPGNSLEDIRVVPNPFNIRAKDLQYGESGRDRITFLDIPPVCTIRIFTERGDLIKVIEHTDGTGDEIWDSVTSSRQIVVSGVYIAHFETPEGETAIRKFVIIR